ncbi:MAG: hypothetical protein QME64_01180, partial [bacterium]|nr:hypothetical protein [bacterium]
ELGCNLVNHLRGISQDCKSFGDMKLHINKEPVNGSIGVSDSRFRGNDACPRGSGGHPCESRGSPSPILRFTDS